MIRVLHVMEATTGGTRLHLRQLAENLDRRRFDLTLACSAQRDPFFLDDIASFREAGLVVLDLPMRREVRPLADLRAFLGLCRVMWANDFDIVHTHSSKAGALGRLAAKLCTGARIVHTPHCFAFLHAPGRARLAKALWVACERLLGLLTDRLIVVSEQEREAALRYRIVAPDRVTLLHNGVEGDPHPDAERGARLLRQHGVPPGARLIGTAGLLSPAKGQAHLIDALPAVLAELPDVYCLITGHGELAAELRDRVRRAGIDSRVVFTGHVERYVDLLAALDIFVLPSLWEGMPYAVLEAMALGKPVIASRVGGCPEAVQHGETGLLVEPGDAGGLSRALLELLRDPARGARMGQKGKERARRLFGLQRMVTALEGLYQELAPGTRQAPLQRLRAGLSRARRRPWLAAVATEITFRLRKRHVAALLRRVRGLPRALHIEGTNACNARCVFCAYDQMQRPKTVMGMQDFERVVDQYVAMGGSHVSMTPIVGDPFVDPHLFARLDHLAQNPAIRGFYFFTNAILMTPEASERLLALGERLTVCVSLGGFDAPTYEQVMGVDRFDTVWENLRAFVARRGENAGGPRLEVHLRCPASACAGPRWAELQEWVRRNQVVLARIDTYDSWAGKIDHQSLEAVGLKPRTMPYKRGACELLYMKPVVLADGGVNACACRDVEAELRVGDLGRQSLEQVWNSEAVDALIERHERGDYPEVCRRCTYYVSVYNPLDSRVHRPGLNWKD